MKKKSLLIANIVATIYSGYLFYVFGLPIIKAGGLHYLEEVVQSFKVLFDILGTDSAALNFASTLVTLLGIHIVVFPVGCLAGWIGLVSRKYGFAKLGAWMYLIGTICFPLYIIYGLPITILGFVGCRKQKELKPTE